MSFETDLTLAELTDHLAERIGTAIKAGECDTYEDTADVIEAALKEVQA